MAEYIYNIGLAFSKTASEHADRIALKYPSGETHTYAFLDSLSNQIANYFVNRGLKKGDVIALFNNKTVTAYCCMLAALKVGVIYTNLDITSPYQRIKKILERCQPKLLLFDIINPEVKTDIHRDLDTSVVDIDASFKREIEAYSADMPLVAPTVTGAEGAYIMFTSGSTGFPKGAIVTHSNLLNFISWGQSTFNVSTEDVFTNANPIYFDNSVFDFYVSLFSGAQLVPFTNDQAKDPFTLVAEVERNGCTSWFSVPSLLVYLLTTKAISAGKLPQMKRFIFGGEGFPKPKLKKLFELFKNTATLYNVYGPTECTCICSSYIITESDFEDMNNLAPLGFLAPNFDYVLIGSETSNPLFGELGLKGPNVCAGYFKDADRTAKSFIQNPYNPNYNEIIYRTGDLVQVDEKGHLHFKGRADNQIKHMGYRIELEEIESLLNTLNYIDEAAVIYEKLGDGLGQILAYVSAGKDVISEQVLADIKNLVPDYMVPKKVFILKTLPKNQNGKIDRVALKEKTATV